MKTHFALPAVVCCFVAGTVLFAAPAFAQDQPAVHPPQKYLMLGNMAIKPNMTGAVVANERSQVQSRHEYNAPGGYLGLINITGAPRALFFSGYDSFADMEKEHGKAIAEDQKLKDALKTENSDEASMLTETHRSIYMFRDDLSLNAAVDISQYRFFDITLFHVANGHYQDWEHLVKLYIKAYSTVPNGRWAMFVKMYGEGSDRTFILVTPLKTLGEEDQAVIDSNNLPKTVGADQMQMMRELGSKTVESAESDLFAIVPQMSYVPESWIKSSPDFWGKK